MKKILIIFITSFLLLITIFIVQWFITWWVIENGCIKRYEAYRDEERIYYFEYTTTCNVPGSIPQVNQ